MSRLLATGLRIAAAARRRAASRMRRLAAAVAVALALPGVADAEFMLVGIDRKFAYDDAGKRQALEPRHDELLVFDLKDPAAPLLAGSLPLENSIAGPPTNLAVTPDQKLALVANSLHSERTPDGKGWRAVPADELFVIDLAAQPPRLLSTLKVGAQPSGVAIDRTGSLALVANREGRSVSVLSIRGSEVTVTDTVVLDDAVSSVAIAPDGRRALAVKFAAHKVALLSIDATGKVRYEGRDLPVGLWPYTVAITADGKTALVGITGNAASSDGNLDPVTVVDLASEPPRTVDYVTVGDAVEGLVASPRGGLALATVLQGSYDAPKGAAWAHPSGRVVALRIDQGGVRVASTVDVGAFPEGIGFSADGRYAYAGNFASHTISVLRVGANGELTDTHRDIALPGPPASLRVGSQ